MEPATQQIVDSIPRFVIPAEKIVTHSNQGATPATPAPAAPETPSAAKPEASPEKAAPPAASEPATPPETAKTEDAKAPEDKDEPEKVTTEKDPESDGRKASRSYERRIDRVTKRAALAEAKAEAIERELAEIKAKQAPAADPEEPRADQFTDIEEFKKAVAAHAVKKADAAREVKQREESQKQEQVRLAERWEEVADEGTTKYPDFHEKVGDLKPTTPWAVAIMESENGHEVAYHLATHPKEAERIVGLPWRQQFLEIGKLSVKLAAQPEPVKKPSKAPPPIAPETGAATVPVTDPFKPQPFEQYIKNRPKEFSGGYRS